MSASRCGLEVPIHWQGVARAISDKGHSKRYFFNIQLSLSRRFLVEYKVYLGSPARSDVAGSAKLNALTWLQSSNEKFEALLVEVVLRMIRKVVLVR